MSQQELSDLLKRLQDDRERLKIFNNTTHQLMENVGIYRTQAKGREYIVVEVREREEEEEGGL